MHVLYAKSNVLSHGLATQPTGRRGSFQETHPGGGWSHRECFPSQCLQTPNMSPKPNCQNVWVLYVSTWEFIFAVLVTDLLHWVTRSDYMYASKCQILRNIQLYDTNTIVGTHCRQTLQSCAPYDCTKSYCRIEISLSEAVVCQRVSAWLLSQPKTCADDFALGRERCKYKYNCTIVSHSLINSTMLSPPPMTPTPLAYHVRDQWCGYSGVWWWERPNGIHKLSRKSKFPNVTGVPVFMMDLYIGFSDKSTKDKGGW